MNLNIIDNINCIDGLKALPDNSVDCCVTSPPYYGLRDYGSDEQIGVERTPELFIQSLVSVFEEVRRVLKPEGTLWLNIGDSYASGARNRTVNQSVSKSTLAGSTLTQQQCLRQINKVTDRLKPKDLIGIPWMLAFALRESGWYLRQDIIWAKKNCMPESVKDRPTRSHEYIFLLSKSEKYYYDFEAIKEPAIYDVDGTGTAARKARQKDNNKSLPTEYNNGIRPGGFKDASKNNGKNSKQRGHSRKHAGFNERWDQMSKLEQCTGMRNKRDVWSISPAKFPGAHFATFPEEIPFICIKAGSPAGGVILDPFMGAGTTALVARKLGRNYLGFELNAEYIKIAEKRLKTELGMFI